MTWATAPYATGENSIAMTATTAADTSGVEYYFDCTTAGGHDSGWQDSATYEDTGLQPETQYTYQVKARDKSPNQNETGFSPPASATTDALPDTDPPAPDPMTWATAPYATGTSSISMTATTATDPSGVEYYFDCLTAGGHDSGWQDAATYEDTGLAAGTSYTYQVKARDKSLNLNETGFSPQASATTDEISTDDVTIILAEYNPDRRQLRVRATSSWQPDVTLTLVDFGVMTYKKNFYEYKVKPVDCPPTVTVVSSGGGSDTYAFFTVDEDPPVPDPMTWAVEPHATGSYSIAMTATTAADENGVEYYFECLTAGGHDSGWQDGTTYEDTGLTPETEYSYHVKARDKSSNQNETGFSTTVSATTDSPPPPDTDPPTPDPMVWAAVPYATGSSSIAMTASTASDPSGVEYYFECLTSGGHDSGWQDGTTYEDTGLAPGTAYTYRVKARDKSLNLNETGYSPEASATTDEVSTDVVTIMKAEYRMSNGELKVEATSSEQPNAVLTVVGYGQMTWNGSKSKYTFKERNAADPGATVTVTSSLNGTDTHPVTHK